MCITDYFQQIEKILIECPAIVLKEISYDQRTTNVGFIKGAITFVDSSCLYFKEFIDTEADEAKYTYGYHYQKDNNLIFRYDNYIHSIKSNLPIHHKHLPSTSEFAAVSEPPSLTSILKEIISILP